MRCAVGTVMAQQRRSENEIDGVRILLITGVIVALILVVGPTLSMIAMMSAMGTIGTLGPMGMMAGAPVPYMQQMPMSGMGAAMALVWLLIIAGLVAVVVWASRRTPQDVAPSRQDGLSVLGRRYAGGEIQREEYERIRADLLRDRS